jgi:outer membrane lipoprotein-sorting protein
MTSLRTAFLGLAAAIAATFAGAVASADEPAPDLRQILERNAAARGGLEGWRKVKTMMWTGHVERADGSAGQAPFLFEQKRPNLTRFEILVDRERSVRVFDGKQGWKLRQGPSGRPAQEPYGEAEARAARDALVIDGPILDATSKGIEVSLEGVDEVEGRRAYLLRAKLPSGTTQRVWIDAQSFLEVKFDRPALDRGGRPTTVAVFLRNYQTYEGLLLPLTIETGAPGGGPMLDRLVIDRVAFNPDLPDALFGRPDLLTPRRGVIVDARGPAPRPSAPRAPSR